MRHTHADTGRLSRRTPGGPAPAPAPAPRRDTTSDVAGPYCPTGAADSVTAWLDLMTSLMQVAECERRAVREELASHLADRVRDLTLGGASEAQASARAISELGDAAQVARRFQDAIEPSKRRLIMQVAALCLAGTAVLFSGVAVATRSGGTPEAGTPPAAGRGTPLVDVNIDDASPTLLRFLAWRGAGMNPAWEIKTDIGASRFEPPLDEGRQILDNVKVGQSGEIRLDKMLDLLAKDGTKVIVRWDRFEAVGMSRDSTLFSADASSSVGSVLRELNVEQLDAAPAASLKDGVLIIAPQGFLDRQDQTLVSYDLGPIIDARGTVPSDTVEEVRRVIQTIVYSNTWKDNGGELASMTSFDRRLFVTAPRRHQTQIEWVLREMRAGVGAAAEDAGAGAGHGAGAGASSHNRFFGTEPGTSPFASAQGAGTRASGLYNAAMGGHEAGHGAAPITERLYVTPEGAESIRIELLDGKVAVREKDRARLADSVEILLPKGWWVKDEWDRPVVPPNPPKAGNGENVVFTAPYGKILAGVWRQSGFSGKTAWLMPPDAKIDWRPAGGGDAPAGAAGGGGSGAGGPSGGGSAGTAK